MSIYKNDNQSETTNSLRETSNTSSSQISPFEDNRPEAKEEKALQESIQPEPLDFQDNRPEAVEQQNLQQGLQRSQTEENTTGLPDELKMQIEELSGFELNEVEVHYNSPEPAKLGAHAFAKGMAIYLAPGAEQHLPEELWHVVQQMKGSVEPTAELQGGLPLNNDPKLEQEAMNIGQKLTNQSELSTKLNTPQIGQEVVQRRVIEDKSISRDPNGYKVQQALNNMRSILPTDLDELNIDVVFRLNKDRNDTEGETYSSLISSNGYSVSLDDTYNWSGLKKDDKLKISINLNSNNIANKTVEVLTETLIHEWSLHGYYDYKFVKDKFRKHGVGVMNTLRFDFKMYFGKLGAPQQHAQLYKSRKKGLTKMDKDILEVGSTMELESATALYEEYISDIKNHHKKGESPIDLQFLLDKDQEKRENTGG